MKLKYETRLRQKDDSKIKLLEISLAWGLEVVRGS